VSTSSIRKDPQDPRDKDSYDKLAAVSQLSALRGIAIDCVVGVCRPFHGGQEI
jgi:hypothetical protein